uniref:Uncharacterized protein n=1 Tax=Romanomermis culicivorax TaxID=13658 RepID=A0A915ITM5_ROMCU
MGSKMRKKEENETKKRQKSYSEALLALFFGRRIDWSGKAPVDCSEAGYGVDGTPYKEDPKTRDGILSYTYGQDFMTDGSSGPFKPFCLRKGPTILRRTPPYSAVRHIGIYSSYLSCTVRRRAALHGTVRHVSAVRRSAARSPAFEIPNYDLELAGVPLADVTSDLTDADLLPYSTWVETRWDRSWLKLFHKANPLWEATVFVFGLVYFQICLILGFCLYRTSGKLFAGAIGDQVAAL